jgi:hypothetical protein
LFILSRYALHFAPVNTIVACDACRIRSRPVGAAPVRFDNTPSDAALRPERFIASMYGVGYDEGESGHERSRPMTMTPNPSSNYFELKVVSDGVYAAIAKRGTGAVGNAGIIDLGEETVRS